MDTLRRVPGGKWRYVNGRHQWFSDLRVENPAKYTGRTGRSFHLAYITEEEGRILNFLGMIQEWFSAMAQDDYRNEGEYSGLAPLSWISEPSHAVSMLVYITQNGANVLKRLDLHGSGVDKHDHFGPLGIPSYQGDGGGGGGGGGGTRGDASSGGLSGGGLSTRADSPGGLSRGAGGEGLSDDSGSLGASAAASASVASSAVTGALAVSRSPMTRFFEAVSKPFQAVSHVANLAMNPSPLAKVGSALALGQMINNADFSLGSMSLSGAPQGAVNSGGLNLRGDGGRNNANFAINGGNAGGVYFGGGDNRADLPAQNPAAETQDVSGGNRISGTVSSQSSGEVGNAKANSLLITQAPIDFKPIAATIAALYFLRG